MSGIKHTPGPWRLQFLGNYDADLIHKGTFAGINAGSGAPGKLDADEFATWEADCRLIAAAPDYDAAAGLAITALAFEQERAQRAGDELAYRQITTAKNALIAAQNKARGEQPEMRDVTPSAREVAP